jgi:hypothetical protein
MGTWKLISIWFLVFFGEILFIGHFPWISIVLLVGMMAYDIPKRYKIIRRENAQSGIFYHQSEIDLDDITTYRTTKEIFACGRFTPEERNQEYRRRGKSPSGVIDGIYNDMNLENGASYNDMDRDWEADA